MDAPLPHLSGPPPVPRPVKRARFALALSIGAWLTFVLFWVAIAVLVRGKGGKSLSITVPILGWKVDGDGIALVSLLTSGALGIPGTVIGFTQRKRRVGKIAGILGSVLLALWILLVVAAVLSGDKN